MGFFSWKTSDTERSICNKFSPKPTFTVFMAVKVGSEVQIHRCNNYEGYGEFGGVDYFEALAMANGEGMNRDAGLVLEDMGFAERVKFFEHEENAKSFDEWPISKRCQNQGFFY